MKNIIKYKNIVLILIMGFTFVFTGCEEKFSTEDVELYVRDSIVGTVSRTSIMAGDSVTYTDLTINGHPRSWVFEGGIPETSTDSVVTVTYPKSGEYIALLNVKYRDNIVNTLELPTVFVEGLPEPDEYQPMFSVSYGIYTEYDKVTPGVALTLKPNKQFVISEVEDEPYEGKTSLAFKADGSSDWAMASILPESGPVDLSAFATGYYNIALKSTSNGSILLRLQGGGAKAIITFTADGEEYGFKRDGEWHMLEIPIADFLAAEPALDLSAITDFLVFRSEGDVRSANNYDFYVDNLFFSKGNVKQTFTQSQGFYTENENVSPLVALTLLGNKQFVIKEEFDDPYEGQKSLAFKTDASSDWAMASIQPESGPVDISDFADGFYNVALKSTSNGSILLRLQGGGKAIIKFTAAGEEYGFVRDGEWHWIQIPIAHFVAAEPTLDLSAITDFLVFRSEGDVRSANNYDFYLDNFFLSK